MTFGMRVSSSLFTNDAWPVRKTGVILLGMVVSCTLITVHQVNLPPSPSSTSSDTEDDIIVRALPPLRGYGSRGDNEGSNSNDDNPSKECKPCEVGDIAPSKLKLLSAPVRDFSTSSSSSSSNTGGGARSKDNNDVHTGYENNPKNYDPKYENKAVNDRLTLLPNFLQQNIVLCDTIFADDPTPPGLPVRYQQVRPLLDAELKRLDPTGRSIEGNSGRKYEQTLVYSLLARSPSVRTICEIGFNAGHSTLVWLSSNAVARIYSFDLGEHDYSRKMADFLRQQFPSNNSSNNGSDFLGHRLTITWGDSAKTVPEFIQANPKLKCDLLIVDGNHEYEGAKLDLVNMRELAHAGSYVLLDDYPRKILPGIERAWFEMIKDGRVRELWKCMFQDESLQWEREVIGKGAFAIGKYLFH